MRLMLVVLLCAACANAQYFFGPDTLDAALHSENTRLYWASADTFGVLWGPRGGFDVPGSGQKYRLDGTPAGGRYSYNNRFPNRFESAAELTIVPLPGGGEVRHIGHSASAHNEVQFVPPGGSPQMARIWGLSTCGYLCPWDNGVFFTYWTDANTQGGGHVIYWCDDQGTAVSQDTLFGPPAAFAYTGGNHARFVHRRDYQAGSEPWQSLVIHTVYDDRRQDPPDTILTERLTGSPVLQNAFTAFNDSMAGVQFNLYDNDFDGQYDVFRIRLVQYSPESAAYSTWQEFMPYRTDVDIVRPVLARLSDGTFLVTYLKAMDQNSEIRFASIDPQGVVRHYPRRIVLTADQFLSGLDVKVAAETVYYTFSTEHEAAAPDGLFNVILGAFPVSMLDEDEAADDPAPVVRSAGLSVYPNPFNGAARLQFDLPRESMLGLDVFDVNGRHVQTLAKTTFAAGSHSVLWQADNLSTGVYFIRMTTPHAQTLHKALLVR
jgi:hypothetical protein